TPLVRSQQSSFTPTRTTLACHERMTSMEGVSAGPSKVPQPRMHAYSVPERFTPIRRTGCPSPLSSWFPDTLMPLSAGGPEATAYGTLHVFISEVSNPKEA